MPKLSIINRENRTKVIVRQCKYLNKIGQDHRAVKRITLPIQGFKDFRCAQIILGGVELMHMIRKGQTRDDGRGLSARSDSQCWRSNTDWIAHQRRDCAAHFDSSDP